MTRPVLRLPLVLPVFAWVALLAGCVAEAADGSGDSWGVRLTGQGLETLSDVNTDKPAHAGELPTRRVATRNHGKTMIELHADSGTAARLEAEPGTYAVELDEALD